jgi:transcription elongation GreA/GreB family factor
MSRPEKRPLIAAVLAQLKEELAHLEAATQAALSAATDEESRPENQYDTRALEASYLAAAQGKRVQDVKRMIAVLEDFPVREMSGPLGSGSLAEVETEGRKLWYFLLPFGAGVAAGSNGHKVTVVTIDSPLGKLLMGKKPGDLVALPRPGGAKEYEILEAF